MLCSVVLPTQLELLPSECLVLRGSRYPYFEVNRYDAAARIKANADALEEHEFLLWKSQRDAAINQRYQRLRRQQRQEQHSLEVRLNAAKEQLRVMHEVALERLVRRYRHLQEHTGHTVSSYSSSQSIVITSKCVQ